MRPYAVFERLRKISWRKSLNKSCMWQLRVNGDVSVPEIRDSIGNEFGLTQQEREQVLKSGAQRVLDNRLHWARIYLAKAGLLVNPKRGRFVVTELGKALLARNPETISSMKLG